MTGAAAFIAKVYSEVIILGRKIIKHHNVCATMCPAVTSARHEENMYNVFLLFRHYLRLSQPFFLTLVTVQATRLCHCNMPTSSRVYNAKITRMCINTPSKYRGFTHQCFSFITLLVDFTYLHLNVLMFKPGLSQLLQISLLASEIQSICSEKEAPMWPLCLWLRVVTPVLHLQSKFQKPVCDYGIKIYWS